MATERGLPMMSPKLGSRHQTLVSSHPDWLLSSSRLLHCDQGSLSQFSLGLEGDMSYSIAVTVAVIFLRSTYGLSCAPCWSHGCDPAPYCDHGIVKDVCGCCDVCANGPGQPCNGPFQINGKCGEGLQCEVNIPDGSPYLLHALEGICVPDKKKVLDNNLPDHAEEDNKILEKSSRKTTSLKHSPRPLPLALGQPSVNQPKVTTVYRMTSPGRPKYPPSLRSSNEPRLNYPSHFYHSPTRFHYHK